MPIQVISGDISRIVIPRGYGVVPTETIGPGATQAPVPLARVAPVTVVTPQNARQQQTRSVIFWRISDLVRENRVTYDLREPGSLVFISNRV